MYSARKRRSISKDGPTPVNPVVFLGDTLMYKWAEQGIELWNHLYAPLNAANFACVNDSTQMLIEKLESDEILIENARTAVLMIGATDIRFRIKEIIIFQQVKKIILLLQQSSPGIKILVLGIMPRGDKLDHLPIIQETNELLSNVENGFTIRWLDMWSQFVDSTTGRIIEDLFEEDEANLSERGYQIWANAMASTFEDCLARD
ncbi:unnamed protein product [Orchesella dallaii]|uniref:SGNH hydrolase-type esterase domain-containing protein n=1 Tax=Orchesella dallaii TaxID=48710 RepID=A0ABP1QXA6_9HEXA